MSYMRGDYYAYGGWCGNCDSQEGCENCAMTMHGMESYCGCGEHDKRPSISMPMGIWDSLVVMRFAELLTEGKVNEAVERVVKSGFGNFGATDLANLCGYDPTAEWVEEMGRRQEAHLAECKDPENCGSPGYHRHKHHGRRIAH